MVFQNRGGPQGNIKEKKIKFFLNRSRPVRDSCPGRKNPGLEFDKKLIGYGILPGCPGRVCPVIARFLAGGQDNVVLGSFWKQPQRVLGPLKEKSDEHVKKCWKCTLTMPKQGIRDYQKYKKR